MRSPRRPLRRALRCCSVSKGGPIVGDKKKKKVVALVEGGPEDFKTGTKRVMTKKQIRARARRGRKITERELELLYKPMDEWDEEELARGRPRAADGTFRGKSPSWITREQYETALGRFKQIVEGRMR